MESSQERLFPPWKPPKNLNARRTASCATSSASCSLRVSQRAKLYAASKCGIIVSSKRACLSCSSNRFSLPCGSRPLFKTDVPRSLFPSSSLFIRNIQPAWPVCMNGSAARAARENNPINLKSRGNMPDIIKHNHDKDGVDRRGFLKCMAWAGTGVLWTMTGGILKSQPLGRASDAAALAAGADLSFVQISDSHIGFNKEANKDVAATLREAVAKINALPKTPSFMLHTGDLTHPSEAEEFDTLDQILKGCKTRQVFYVPGEHDVINDNGQQYRDLFGKGSKGSGWYSFDQKCVHFGGQGNAKDTKEGGLGVL